MNPWIDGPADNFTLALALDESIKLWRALAISGCQFKQIVAKRLFARGRLCSKYDHSHSCPLCAYGYQFIANHAATEPNKRCTFCPWPGRAHYQCLHRKSPYAIWSGFAHTRKERQKAASAVLRLLKKLRKELQDEL